MLWIRRIFLPLLFAIAPIAILKAGTRATIDPVALSWIGFAFTAVCAALVAAGLIGAKLPFGAVLQAIAGLAYGAFVTFHLREVTAHPPSTIGLVIGSVIVGVVAFFVLRFTCGRYRKTYASSRAEQTMPESKTVGWRWLAVTALVALLTPLALFAAGGKLRWHLLQHVKVLGSPTFAILGTSPIEQELEMVSENALSGADAAREITQRFGPAATPFSVTEASPPIVFVMLDTLRADAFRQFGGPTNLMPKLSRTFEQCQAFTNITANSSWTRPSIASMFTGLLPEHHGARSVTDPLEPGHTTFVEVLSSAGYSTIGLQSNPTAGTNSGLGQGFAQFTEIERDPYPRAEVMNKAALTFLGGMKEPELDNSQGAAPPLFLYLQYLDPHEPYLSGKDADGWSAGSYREAYAAELAYLDEQLALLLPQLRAQLGPNTLFFFISDHGEEFFEHELFGHGHTLYREVIDIPAALCGGPFAGGEVTARLEGRDVFSLILGLANGSVRSNTDLARWARTHQRSQRYASLSFQGFGRLQLRPYLQTIFQRMVETPESKWIWNAYGDTWELYAESDRSELDNLADRGTEKPQEEFDQMTPPAWYKAEPIQMSEEDRARIEGLGYVQ